MREAFTMDQRFEKVKKIRPILADDWNVRAYWGIISALSETLLHRKSFEHMPSQHPSSN